MENSSRSGEWPDLLREFVLRRQRERYRCVGERLGLGSDPQVVFDRLTRPPMPRPDTATAAANLPLGREGRTQFQRSADAAYERMYAGVEPPTPLEDPNRYAVLKMCFEMEKDGLTKDGAQPVPEPALATLPLGSPNAWISEVPGSEHTAIFFDHGLVDFLFDFSKVVGLVLPVLPIHRMGDPEIAALAGHGSYRLSVSPVASTALVATFFAWAGESRSGEPSPVPEPRGNALLAAGLLHYIERFVVAHELAHLRLGHLVEGPREDGAASYALEFEADRAGANSICRGNPREAGPWGFRRWAADLALTAFGLLDRALCRLVHGGARVVWISPTHPDFFARRQRLRRESGQEGRSEVEMLSYETLCSLSDTLLGQLWPMVQASLEIARQRGVALSPLWRRRMETSLRVQSSEGE